jgi:hypothetical protein
MIIIDKSKAKHKHKQRKTYKMDYFNSKLYEFSRDFQKQLDKCCDELNLDIKRENVKQLYAMFLKSQGKEYLESNDKFRFIVELKIREHIEDPEVQLNIQFLAISRAVLTIITNINLGKNL